MTLASWLAAICNISTFPSLFHKDTKHMQLYLKEGQGFGFNNGSVLHDLLNWLTNVLCQEVNTYCHLSALALRLKFFLFFFFLFCSFSPTFCVSVFHSLYPSFVFVFSLSLSFSLSFFHLIISFLLSFLCLSFFLSFFLSFIPSLYGERFQSNSESFWLGKGRITPRTLIKVDDFTQRCFKKLISFARQQYHHTVLSNSNSGYH